MMASISNFEVFDFVQSLSSPSTLKGATKHWFCFFIGSRIVIITLYSTVFPVQGTTKYEQLLNCKFNMFRNCELFFFFFCSQGYRQHVSCSDCRAYILFVSKCLHTCDVTVKSGRLI